MNNMSVMLDYARHIVDYDYIDYENIENRILLMRDDQHVSIAAIHPSISYTSRNWVVGRGNNNYSIDINDLPYQLKSFLQIWSNVMSYHAIERIILVSGSGKEYVYAVHTNYLVIAIIQIDRQTMKFAIN